MVRVRWRQDMRPALAADVARIDELWSEGLYRFGGPFLTGSGFTAVDAFFAPVAFRVQTYGIKLGADAAAYVQRLLELPAMQRWYADALRESWRDAGHEEDVLRSGAPLRDLRAAVD